ncbi:MAG: hypothetical protein JXB18_11300 [Sedimentisphaerales bacterium]|nr:hypothetical protein [Sedimentisphaerales bacterium]
MDPKELENELLKSLDESFDVQEPSADSLASDQIPNEFPQWLRLGQLILRMQDGELEKRYLHRLEKWLMADPEAFDYYVQFTWLCTSLYMLYNPRKTWLEQAAKTKTTV